MRVETSELSDSMSGLLIDDAVASLGKTRADASVAGGEAKPLTILAVAVQGVSTDELERAVIEHWPASDGAFKGTLSGREVQLLDHPGEDYIVVLRSGNAVYVVSAPDSALIEQAVSGLPR